MNTEGLKNREKLKKLLKIIRWLTVVYILLYILFITLGQSDMGFVFFVVSVDIILFGTVYGHIVLNIIYIISLIGTLTFFYCAFTVRNFSKPVKKNITLAALALQLIYSVCLIIFGIYLHKNGLYNHEFHRQTSVNTRYIIIGSLITLVSVATAVIYYKFLILSKNYLEV